MFKRNSKVLFGVISIFCCVFMLTTVTANSAGPDFQDFRKILTELKYRDPHCCSPEGPLYTLPYGIGLHPNEIKKEIDLKKEKLSIGGKKVLYFHDKDFPSSGYYVIDSSEHICVGNALFEETGYQIGNDFYSKVEELGFALESVGVSLELPPGTEVKFFKRGHNNSIERLVIATVTISESDNAKISYVVAEMHYAADMEQYFYPLLVEWLNGGHMGGF